MTTDFSVMLRVVGIIKRFFLRLIRSFMRKNRVLLGA
jgi:hypothetical protein